MRVLIPVPSVVRRRRVLDTGAAAGDVARPSGPERPRARGSVVAWAPSSNDLRRVGSPQPERALGVATRVGAAGDNGDGLRVWHADS